VDLYGCGIVGYARLSECDPRKYLAFGANEYGELSYSILNL